MISVSIKKLRKAISYRIAHFCSNYSKQLVQAIRYKQLKYIYLPCVIAYMAYIKKINPGITSKAGNNLPYTKDTLETMDHSIISKMKFLQYGISHGKNTKYLVFKTNAYSGLGSHIQKIIACLITGSLYNRTVILDTREAAYDSPYEPIANLSVNDISRIPSPDTQETCFNYLPQQKKTVCWGNYSRHLRHLYKMYLQKHNQNFNICPVLEHLPRKNLYCRGLVMQSFLKLKEEYGAHIDERRRALNSEGPRIGVHIRQGDTMYEAKSRHFTVGSYIQTMEAVVAATGINTVFITTDSDKALRQLPKHSGINFIYDDREKRYDSGNTEMIRNNPSMKKQEAMTAIKNIYLLADCDYIIGTHSNLTACALGLSYYRRKSLNAVFLLNTNPRFQSMQVDDKVRIDDSRELNGVCLEDPVEAHTRLACLVIRHEK